MKILVINDWENDRMNVVKYLEQLGHETFAAKTGLESLRILKKTSPDLIIADLDIPENSGLAMLSLLKDFSSPNTPIILISGNLADSVIREAFRLGVKDYLKKPVSLAELDSRVTRIMGTSLIPELSCPIETLFEQDYRVGVVIPCKNEVNHINPYHFQKFLDQNPGYRLCFVNYASTDDTLKLLERIRKDYEDRVQIYNLRKVNNKAEAIRKGMLYTAANTKVDYLGYLNADLNANIDDFNRLVQTLKSTGYVMVSGSRVQLVGKKFNEGSAVAAIQRSMNFLVRKLMGVPFREIHSGAKVMRSEFVPTLFNDRFSTRLLFDVELFLRLRRIYGCKEAFDLVCDIPLQREFNGMSLETALQESIFMSGQLLKILNRYLLTFYFKKCKHISRLARSGESKSKRTRIDPITSVV